MGAGQTVDSHVQAVGMKLWLRVAEATTSFDFGKSLHILSTNERELGAVLGRNFCITTFFCSFLVPT